MSKFIKVFLSQAFNSFFPVLIVGILLHIANKNEAAPVFIILNFANIYLLFTDYSSNIRFLKSAMELGGIRVHPPAQIVRSVQHYLSIKIITLAIGFIPWVIICVVTPLLRYNLFASIIAYPFIIGYNLNFYWMYTVSNKEYFFILSNFASRLILVLFLFAFLHWQLSFTYLMFSAGLTVSLVSLGFFFLFCKKHRIRLSLGNSVFRESFQILREDVKLVLNNFSLMVPTISLGFFIGYINNPAQVVVYAFAEKLFLGFRTLLSISVNSIYPVLCAKKSLPKRYVQKLLLFFYTAVLAACAVTYLLHPLFIQYFHLNNSLSAVFKTCLFYFLLTIVVISINVPFFLWLMLHNQITTRRTSFFMSVTAVLILIVFLVQLALFNTVLSLVQSLLVAESLIVLTLLFLYKTRRPGFTPEAVVPSV